MPRIFKKERRVLDPEISYKKGPQQNKLIAFSKKPLYLSLDLGKLFAQKISSIINPSLISNWYVTHICKVIM